MSKKIVLPIVIAVLVVGALYLATRSGKAPTMSPAASGQASPTPSQKPTQPKVQKGEMFKNSSVYPMAYQIFPGNLSDSAKTATKGWTIKTTTQKDGSTMVELLPSEQTDKMQKFVVAKGQTLYFVELNPIEDTTQKDVYLLDDYGVLVGADGTVQ